MSLQNTLRKIGECLKRYVYNKGFYHITSLAMKTEVINVTIAN